MKYKEREYIGLSNTCECGHCWFAHSWFAGIPLLERIYSPCTDCMCPNFNSVGKRTFKERMNWK